MISDEVLVSEIKKRLGITGDHHDALLLAYANDTKEYMHSAGVPGDVVDGEASVGVISRGVADLWNLGAGEGHFSGLFYQRVTQMALTEWGVVDASGVSTTLIAISNEEIDECTECLEQPSGSSGEQLTMVAMSEEEINACIDCLTD